MKQGNWWSSVVCAWLVVGGAQAQVDARAHAPRVVESALSFESNVGQAAPRFRFVAHRGSHALAIDGQGALRLMTRAGGLEMKLVDACTPSSVRGESLATARVNVFRGAPEDWVRGAPTYARVRAVGVYPGVDLVHHVAGGELEYDFEVAPGADAHRIRMRFEGVHLTRLLADGSLVHTLASGELRQRPPRAYQDIDGRRREVAVAFRLEAGELSFALGAYDHDAPLVIDPVVIFATYLGGSDDEVFGDMAVSDAGKLVIVGRTLSTDLPVAGASQDSLGHMGVSDAFVSIYRADGLLAFTTYFGGRGADAATALTIERSGQFWVAGTTLSLAPEELPDPHGGFPLTDDAMDRHGYSGGAFLAHFDGVGGLLYSTFLGLDVDHPITPRRLWSLPSGGLTLAAEGVLADASGGVAAGAQDGGFVGELTPSGQTVWGATLSGSGVSVRGLLRDSAGRVWISGGAQTFTPTDIAYTPTGDEAELAFVARFDRVGGTTDARSYLFGEGTTVAIVESVDSVYALSRADAAGSVFDPGSAPTDAGPWAALSHFDLDGLLGPTARILPSSAGLSPEDMVALDTGSLLIAGAAEDDTLFDRSFGGDGGGRDAFMAELSITDAGTLATAVEWATLYGGADDDTALRVDADAHGSQVVVGETSSVDMPVTEETQPHGGARDVFALSIGSEARRDALTPSSISLTLEDAGSVVACGSHAVLSIRVRNDSDIAALNIHVTGSADIPEGGRFASAPGICATSATDTGIAFDCPLGDIPAYGESYVALAFDFPPPPDGGLASSVLARGVAMGSNTRPTATATGYASSACPGPRDPRPGALDPVPPIDCGGSSFGPSCCGRCGVAPGTHRLGWMSSIAFGLLLYHRRRRR